MTECLKLTIVRVANSRKEINVEVLHRQLTGERMPRTHRNLQGNPQSVHLSSSRVVLMQYRNNKHEHMSYSTRERFYNNMQRFMVEADGYKAS
jgi:hypothetical protein